MSNRCLAGQSIASGYRKTSAPLGLCLLLLSLLCCMLVRLGLEHAAVKYAPGIFFANDAIFGSDEQIRC